MRYLLATFVILLLGSCLNRDPEAFLQKARYDASKNMLVVDYQLNPDTSLQQIILLAGIRDSGYGVLLSPETEPGKKMATEILNRLVKLDINAVHHYSITSDSVLDPVLTTAIAGAKFVWVLPNEKPMLRSNLIRIQESSAETLEASFLLVVSKE